ncbi:MAG TPA: hypothetical protein VN944_10690 [Nitrospiria bacterium]|nr:hypothetical protein [Nitrospiria bacterium]
MSYFDAIHWNKIKADLEKELKQGVLAFKKGAMVVKEKADQLSEEGLRQYKILSLKTKVYKGISDLGARVYSLMGSKGKNPALDTKVKGIAAQIKKYKTEIASLDKASKKTARKRIKKTA